MAAAPPSAPPAQASPQQGSWWDSFREIIILPIDKSILMTVPELGHLSPIIFTAAAALMAAITFNYPLAMFAASTMEASLVYRIITPFAQYAATPDTIRPEGVKGMCTSYFHTLTASRFGKLLDTGLVPAFPNYSLYYIVFAVSYCIQSLLHFSQECTALGKSYVNRPYLGILSGSLFVVLYTLYLYVYGCDTAFSLLLTIILAALVGYLISYQNVAIFGKESINMLFIPPLVKRSGMDYVCVTTNA